MIRKELLKFVSLSQNFISFWTSHTPMYDKNISTNTLLFTLFAVCFIICSLFCLVFFSGNVVSHRVGLSLYLLLRVNKSIQVRRTRHAGHCWRSRDELISDVLQWTPSHGRAKAGRPARTYIQKLCEDMGCSPEDLPEVMNDRKK